jgi:hypothetical protein
MINSAESGSMGMDGYLRSLFLIKYIEICMIDRVLNLGPVQQDSYYFQLIPISLSIINPDSELPAPGTTYRFSVSKGNPAATQASRSSTRTRSPWRPVSRQWGSVVRCSSTLAD